MLVIVFFLLVFTLIPFDWHRVGDFEFHFNKAGERCDPNYDQQACDSYYPLLHFLGSPFSFSPVAFSNFLMILIVLITPLILFLMTKKWLVAWLYFSATQYVYTIQSGGAYPQSLVGIFLLLFLWQRHPAIRFAILVAASLSHSQAFLLLLLVWLVHLFFENFGSIKNWFPACSARFGRQEVDRIGQEIAITTITKNGFAGINLVLKDIANFFVRTFPLPFLLAALWQLKKEKDWALIAITLIVFYYGFAVGQARIFLVIPLILLPSLTRFYYGLNKKWKRLFIGLTIITFIINFGTWILYKANCL